VISALILALGLLTTPDIPRRRLVLSKSVVVPAIRRRTGIAAIFTLSAVGLALVIPPPAVAAVAAVSVTLAIRHRQARRRRLQIDEAAVLQGALGVLVGELRAGAHPVGAFETAAAEVDGTVAAGLREVAARARLGADVAGGLAEVARNSALRSHWERLAVYWQLAQDHGLAIATLMRAAEQDIGAREQFSSRVRAGMAGARTSAGVLAGLPLLGIGLGQVIGADPLAFLVGDGAVLLLIGALLSCSGLLWSDRITAAVLR